MNPLNLFKFIEKEKGRPIPFKVKLLLGLPLTPKELNVKGNLDLYNTSITSLPQGLKVRGYLILMDTPIASLPSDLQVEENLWIEDTPLAKKSDEEIRAMLKTGYIKGTIRR